MLNPSFHDKLVESLNQNYRLPYEIVEIVFPNLSIPFLEFLGANQIQLKKYSKNMTFSQIQAQLKVVGGYCINIDGSTEKVMVYLFNNSLAALTNLYGSSVNQI